MAAQDDVLEALSYGDDVQEGEPIRGPMLTEYGERHRQAIQDALEYEPEEPSPEPDTSVLHVPRAIKKAAAWVPKVLFTAALEAARAPQAMLTGALKGGEQRGLGGAWVGLGAPLARYATTFGQDVTPEGEEGMGEFAQRQAETSGVVHEGANLMRAILKKVGLSKGPVEAERDKPLEELFGGTMAATADPLQTLGATKLFKSIEKVPELMDVVEAMRKQKVPEDTIEKMIAEAVKARPEEGVAPSILKPEAVQVRGPGGIHAGTTLADADEAFAEALREQRDAGYRGLKFKADADAIREEMARQRSPSVLTEKLAEEGASDLMPIREAAEPPKGPPAQHEHDTAIAIETEEMNKASDNLREYLREIEMEKARKGAMSLEEEEPAYNAVSRMAAHQADKIVEEGDRAYRDILENEKYGVLGEVSVRRMRDLIHSRKQAIMLSAQTDYETQRAKELDDILDDVADQYSRTVESAQEIASRNPAQRAAASEALRKGTRETLSLVRKLVNNTIRRIRRGAKESQLREVEESTAEHSPSMIFSAPSVSEVTEHNITPAVEDMENVGSEMFPAPSEAAGVQAGEVPPPQPVVAPAAEGVPKKTEMDYKPWLEKRTGQKWAVASHRPDRDALRAEWAESHVPTPEPSEGAMFQRAAEGEPGLSEGTSFQLHQKAGETAAGGPAEGAMFQRLQGTKPVPAEPAGKPLPKSGTGTGPVMSMGQMRRTVADLTNAVVSDKGLNLKGKTLGMYRTLAGDVTVKELNNPAPLMHEIAHRLEDVTFGGRKGLQLTGTPFASYANELDPLAGKLVATRRSSKTSEGFAEFFRLYMTDPKSAAAAAPKFYNDFPTMIAAKDPRMAEQLGRLQAEIQRFHSADPSVQMASAIVRDSAHPLPSSMSALEKVKWSLVDDISPLRSAVKELNETGKVPPGWNPVSIFESMRHSAAQMERWMMEGVPSYHNPTQNVGPSLHDAIAAAGDNEALTNYVAATRFKSYAAATDAENAYRVAQAQKTVADLQAQLQTATGTVRKWQLTRKIDAARKALDKAQKTGPLVLPNLFDVRALDRSDPNVQAETRRKLDEVLANTPQTVKDAAHTVLKAHTDAALRYVSDGGFLSGEEFDRILGKNPLYLPLSRNMEEGGRGAGKGMTYLKPAKLSSNREVLDPLQIYYMNVRNTLENVRRNETGLALVKLAMDNPGLAKMVRIVPNETVATTLRETLEPSAQAMGMTVEDFAQMLGHDPKDLESVLAFAGQGPKATGGKNTMTVWNKIGVSGRRPLESLQADKVTIELHPDIADAINKVESKPEANLLFDVMRRSANLFRYGVTQNIAFATVNLTRDTMGSMVTSRAQTIPLVDAFYNSLSGLKSSLTKDAFYQIARDSGALMAEHTDVKLGDMERLKRWTLSPQERPMWSKVLGMVFSDISNAAENATRVGEVKALMRKRGWNPATMTRAQAVELGEAGRQVTVDFARRGAQTKAIMQLSPFVNANLQGWYALYEGIARRPINAGIMMSSAVVMPSALLWYAHKDEPWYKNLSEQSRRDYWHFKFGNTILRFPKPPGVGLVGTAAERLLDAVYAKRPDAIHEIFEAAMATGGTMLPAVGNPLVRLLLENTYGVKSDQPGTSAVPESLKKGEPRSWAYPDQGVASTAIGNMFNVSPVMVERNVRTLFGTLGESAMQGANLTGRVLAGGNEPPSAELKDVPVVGRWVERNVPTGTDAEDYLFRTKADVDRVTQEVKIMAARGDPRLKDYIESHRKELESADMYDKLMKLDEKYHKGVRAVRADASLSSEEKRKRIDALNTEKANLLNRALGY